MCLCVSWSQTTDDKQQPLELQTQTFCLVILEIEKTRKLHHGYRGAAIKCLHFPTLLGAPASLSPTGDPPSVACPATHCHLLASQVKYLQKSGKVV